MNKKVKRKNKLTIGNEKFTYKRNRLWALDHIDPNSGYLKDLQAKADAGCPKAAEALLWLAKFNNEYYNNTGLKDEDALHSTDELRKDCYNRTNAANRDLYSISDCSGFISSLETLAEEELKE
jgi:hypothetical protein